MTTLRYSDFERTPQNRTFKKKEKIAPKEEVPAKSKKVETFLNAMENDTGLADFKPIDEELKHAPSSSSELPNNVTTEEYYKQYIPYFTDTAGEDDYTHTVKDELMEKLNYTIHLLEKQKDEKTDNVTEELVLYLFLGVFVIFVTDSFGRACKYIR